MLPNGQLEPRTGSAQRPACCATERPPRQGRRVVQQQHARQASQGEFPKQDELLWNLPGSP